MTNLEQALIYLLHLIATGMEYPDAEYKAARKNGVSADDLREAYDAL